MKAKIFTAVIIGIVAMGCGKQNQEYDATGVFEATEAIVSARGTGEILELNLSEGQSVAKNQKVGILDITQLELKKQQLESALKSTSGRRLTTDKQVAGLRQQIANLQKEKARFEDLLKEDAATQKQVDDIGYQISVLQKQLSAAEEQVLSANSSISDQSQSIYYQIKQIDDQIRQASILAPIDGVVLSKYAEQGEFAAPGRALFKVGDVKNMKLRAYLSAPQVTTLTLGQKVKVYADIDENDSREFEGTVEWISSEAEFTPKTIQTRDERSNLVYAVKIAVSNPDGIIKRGMYGDLKINN